MSEPSPLVGDNTKASTTFSLETILNDNHDVVEHPGTNGQPANGWDEEVPEGTLVEGFCIECEGEP